MPSYQSKPTLFIALLAMLLGLSACQTTAVSSADQKLFKDYSGP